VKGAGGTVDLVVVKVLSVVLAGRRDLEREEDIVSAHTGVREGGVSGIAVGDADALRVFGIALLEDHGSGEGQRTIGVESGADVADNLVEHALEDGSSGLSRQNLHLLLGASLGEVVSDAGNGAGIVELFDGNQGQDVRVHVDASVGMERTESEQIGAEGGGAKHS